MKYLSSFKQSQKRIENFLKVFDNCIDFNAIDKFEWDNIFKTSKRLKEIEAKGRKEHNKFVTIMQDLFYSLYKLDPKFIDPRRVSHETGFFNRKILEQIMEMSRYLELRAYTTSDELNSGVAVISFAEHLMDLVKERVEEFKKRQEELKQQAQDIQDMLDQMGNVSEDDLTDEMKQMIKDLQKDVNGAMADVPPDLGDVSDTMDSIIEMTESNEQVKRTWGLEQNDSFVRMPYHQKEKVFERLRNSDKLNAITEMLGKFKAILSKEDKTKVNKNVTSLQKTKRSDEFQHAVPAELMKFADEDLELVFWANQSNHALETYEYDNDTEDVKGPIVIAIDESGSMYGKREVWSKACALAVLHQAQVDKRSVYVIHFSYNHRAKDLHVNVFPKDKSLDIEQLIDMAEHFYNGGTSFDQPIERMMQCVSEEEGFDRADGLFITDGECAANKTLLKKLEKFKSEVGFRLYGIHLGSWGADELNKICNKIYFIKELTGELFLEINQRMMDD